MTVQVMIVDDHPTFRAGLSLVMRESSIVDVAAEMSDAEEALKRLREEEQIPDVVLLDLHLPGVSGIEATRAITTQFALDRDRSPKVLILSVNDDDDSVVAALRAGARGFLTKEAALEELVRGVQVVASGGAVFSPGIAARLAGYFSAVHMLPQRAAFPRLTERELEVLDLIARGHDNRRIARELVVAEKTVRNHIYHIFNKLDVGDRSAAIVRARDAGLGFS